MFAFTHRILKTSFKNDKNHSNSRGYRYGFNGQEKDDEVKGNGNSLDFGARIYDSRLGRFLSLDPRMAEFSFMSPYCFAANTPLQAIDVNGEGPRFVNVARVFRDHLIESFGVNSSNITTVVTAENVVISVHLATGEILSYTFSASENYGRETQRLEKWGVNSYDARIAAEPDLGKRMLIFGYKVEHNFPTDGRITGGFENGMTLLLGTWSFILSAGQSAQLAGASTFTKILWGVSMGMTVDNATTVLYEENKTFLSEELGITPDVLDGLKSGIGGVSYGHAMKNYIKNALKDPNLSTNAYELGSLIYDQTLLILDAAEQLKVNE